VARLDELRLMTRVARMYYERDMRQSDIARQLGLSQATISRLFNRARDEGIVRISVNVPQGVYSEMEEELIATYDLRDAIVVDCVSENEQIVQRDIGAAGKYTTKEVSIFNTLNSPSSVRWWEAIGHRIYPDQFVAYVEKTRREMAD